MLPWLFNLFMDAVMKDVREKAGDVGVALRDDRRNIEHCCWVILKRNWRN